MDVVLLSNIEESNSGDGAMPFMVMFVAVDWNSELMYCLFL
jgi:hypothetical protein